MAPAGATGRTTTTTTTTTAAAWPLAFARRANRGEICGMEGGGASMMSPAQMDGMYAVLCGADAEGDAEALADAAYRLYGEAGAAYTENQELRAALEQLAATARATVAAAPQGADDPLAHLRHVLEARGWMPVPGTPVTRLLAGGGLRGSRPERMRGAAN